MYGYENKTLLQQTGLWLNALNAAKIAVSESNNQRKVIEQLLSRCAKDALYEKASSQTFNVVLSAVLFHSLSEPIEASKIDKKHILLDNLKVLIYNTFEILRI